MNTLEKSVRNIWDSFLSLLDFVRLKKIAVATSAFMLAAYMYVYTNGSFIFDASRIYRGPEPFSAVSGKWASSLLGILDAHINLPWLAGILSILFMIVSIYCIVDILEVKKTWSICLIAGLCSTQSSIICQQEYVGGNYTGEIALAFACLAAWIFLKTHIWIGLKAILTVLCIALSAGVYGAYVSMFPSLLLVALIMDIVFRGKSAKETWKKAFLYLGLLMTGIVLYYVILRLGLYFTASSLQSYMGEDSLSSVSEILDKVKYVGEAYKYIFRYYFARNGRLLYLPKSLHRMVTLGMIVGIAISLEAFYRFRKKICDFKYNIALLIMLILIFPLSINLIYVMSSGFVHYLMIFTYVLPYLFFVKEMELCIGDSDGRHYAGTAISILYNIIICVFIYYSIVMANAASVYLDNMYECAQSIGIRIIDRIETCEGFDGTEKIYLIGDMEYNKYFGEVEPHPEILDANVGPINANNINAICYATMCSRFLNNILDSKLEYIPYSSIEAYVQAESVESNVIAQLQEMQVFPYAGSVKKIGDNIYIIFSNNIKGN